ncbi:MAG: hypothetical protein ACMVO3_02645 [Thalassobaculum sp.]
MLVVQGVPQSDLGGVGVIRRHRRLVAVALPGQVAHGDHHADEHSGDQESALRAEPGRQRAGERAARRDVDRRRVLFGVDEAAQAPARVEGAAGSLRNPAAHAPLEAGAPFAAGGF